MFIVQSAVVKGRGGIATAVAHYERMFREVGVRSAVLFQGPSFDALKREGVDVIAPPPLLTSPVAASLPIFGELRATLMQRAAGAPMAILVHSDLTLAALRAVLPGAVFATPCHSDKFKHKARADLIITLNATQDAAARLAQPDVRVALLGNPYVAPSPPPLPPGGPVRFNFVGRFIDTKDPETMLRAAKQTSALNAEFRFIGAGELETDLLRLAAELGVSATFPGWAPAPFAAFHQNDVLVLPSLWEGLPYLLQEALDHGVPIIAADNAGNRTALQNGEFGSLFPLRDVGALSACMERAQANLDELKVKAEKGRAQLRARYGAAGFWSALKAELEQAGASRHV